MTERWVKVHYDETYDAQPKSSHGDFRNRVGEMWFDMAKAVRIKWMPELERTEIAFVVGATFMVHEKPEQLLPPDLSGRRPW